MNVPSEKQNETPDEQLATQNEHAAAILKCIHELDLARHALEDAAVAIFQPIELTEHWKEILRLRELVTIKRKQLNRRLSEP